MSSPAKGAAIITGCGQGIGNGIAIRLASDGYDVAINDLPEKKGKLEELSAKIREKTGRRVLIHIADVSEEEQVKALVDTVVQTLGGLDVMVSNVGVCIPKALVDMDVKTWDWSFATNMRSMMLCYKFAAIQMIAQGRGGRIIGATSLAGKKGGPTMGMYGATKFGIRGLTQCAATELGVHGITVNTYAPGMVDTESLRAAGQAQAGVDVAAVFEALKAQSATKQIAQVEDVAAVVSFLCTKEAHHITGQSISVDGGINFN